MAMPRSWGASALHADWQAIDSLPHQRGLLRGRYDRQREKECAGRRASSDFGDQLRGESEESEALEGTAAYPGSSSLAQPCA